jgi:dTDP-glucose pyrophosphorylase
MNERLAKCQLHQSKRLVDAMRSLDESAAEIVLVTDGEDRLVGTITDGDIRRALLGGASLECPLLPHVQRQFTSVPAGTGRTEVIELMQARQIGQIPVVDGSGRLLGLHLLHELISRQPRPNWAIIMAGGKGTRLGPITENLPKPMVRIAGRPLLERLVLHLVGFGIQRIFLSINYLGHMVEAHFGRGERYGCRIQYLREQQPLGTGGALALLPEAPTAPVLVLNGDLLTQADVGAMFEFHDNGRFLATVAVKRYSHTVPYGCVEREGDRLVQLVEKPVLDRLVNAGVYVLNPEIIARVPRGLEMPMTTLLHDAMAQGDSIGAFEIVDDWLDVGNRDQLKLAREGVA